MSFTIRRISDTDWETRNDTYYEAIGCFRPGVSEFWYLVTFIRDSRTAHTRTWSANSANAFKSQDRKLMRDVLEDLRTVDPHGNFLYEIATVPSPPEEKYSGDPDW